MTTIATVMLITMSLMACPVSALNVNYYENTCPHAESIVAATIHKATMDDKTVPAVLLRMHFHNCFIREMQLLLVLIQFIFIWGKVAVLQESKVRGPHLGCTKRMEEYQRPLKPDNCQLPITTKLPSKRPFLGRSSSPLWFLLSSAFTATYQDFRFEVTRWGSLIVHPSRTESTTSAPNKRLIPLTKMQGPLWILLPPLLTMLITSYSSKGTPLSLLTHPTAKALVSKFAHSLEEFEAAFVKSMIKMSSITNGGHQIRLNCQFVR
ncbi:hypothetical protein VNO78_28592 [Psophocarpus tetragonolobus]|uniref:peroxidase n=1 Tax=Psophocarpus tetragonolobus TaxID=3891 RepID=A0AAN9RTG4_PSOTE